MNHTRREFLEAAGATAVSLALPLHVSGDEPKPKRHIVTLSFDDGFKKSSIKRAQIYEKHKLSACINVVASARPERTDYACKSALFPANHGHWFGGLHWGSGSGIGVGVSGSGSNLRYGLWPRDQRPGFDHQSCRKRQHLPHAAGHRARGQTRKSRLTLGIGKPGSVSEIPTYIGNTGNATLTRRPSFARLPRRVSSSPLTWSRKLAWVPPSLHHLVPPFRPLGILYHPK
jgi:hypothetical protein